MSPGDAAAADGRGTIGGGAQIKAVGPDPIVSGPTRGRVDLERVAQSDTWWHDCARRALDWWADSGQPFDAYDLTELGVPDPDHPSRWGALFSAARSEGRIIPLGYHASRRPTRSGGVCRVWQGATR